MMSDLKVSKWVSFYRLFEWRIHVGVYRGSSGRKNQKKVPKRIHKAEREKMKREHLNDLFSDLSDALGSLCSL